MKVLIRQSRNDDLENIYNLHIECFKQNDCWYKSAIGNHLNSGIVIEYENNIIGVLLQGNISICSPDEIYESINDDGNVFEKDIIRFGIVMICIHPNFRKKGLAKKLINKHFIINKNKLLCLFTRRSNINAYQLYKNMGYKHIAFIKNKYFLPDEDAILMVKDN